MIKPSPLHRSTDLPRSDRAFSIESSDRKTQIRQAMEHCRNLTLKLFEGIDQTTLCTQYHPDFSPIGWHLGHIGYTEALWILEHLAQQPFAFPELRRLYAQDGLPKCDRGQLPTLSEICDWLQTVRHQVFEYLEIAPIEAQERIWQFLLQHESQHCETIAIVLALRDRALPLSNQISNQTITLAPPDRHEIFVPAGPVWIGNEDATALDNEAPARWIRLPDYSIDAYPVTQAQYREFMQAGGYGQAQFWSPEGWQWVSAQGIRQPLYWQEDGRFDHHPVCGVSYYEAEAYARFVNKRLPTEFEWEKAARWDPQQPRSRRYPWGEDAPNPHHGNHSHTIGHTTPVNAYPASKSAIGCYDLLGNVWEWTASWFEGYPGFQAFPYRGYSQAYFDRAHRVLRGGSWATRSWAVRGSFRNWYHPHVREIFAGFRCARSAN